MQVFWDVTPCYLTNSYSNFEESQHFVFRDQAVSTWWLDPWRGRLYDTEIRRNVVGDYNLPRTPLWEYQISFWNLLSRINHWIFGLDGPGFESRKRQDFFLLSKQCGPVMGPTHPPIQRVMGQFFAQAQMGWGVAWPLALLLTKHDSVFRTVVRTNCINWRVSVSGTQ